MGMEHEMNWPSDGKSFSPQQYIDTETGEIFNVPQHRRHSDQIAAIERIEAGIKSGKYRLIREETRRRVYRGGLWDK